MRPVWDLNPYLEDNQFNIKLITEPIGIEPIRNGLQPNALPSELKFQKIKSSGNLGYRLKVYSIIRLLYATIIFKKFIQSSDLTFRYYKFEVCSMRS